MKRFFALVALVLGLASCQTEPEGLDVQMGGAVDATITVNIPETETRAGGTKSAGSIFDNVNLGTENDTNTMRYILQIYDATGQKSKDRKVTYSDGKSVNFDVRLVPGRHYSFVVWADYVTSKDDTDNHYNTADLTNITLNGTWDAMDETRDAFTGVFNTAIHGNKTEYNGAKDIDITLTRPFAKLRVITTDIKELDDLHITPGYATVEYTTEYRPAFNALAGTAVAAGTDKKAHSTVFPIAPYTNEANDKHNRTIFTDYFFANEGDAVSFILNVYEDAAGQTLIKSNNFSTDIAVNRNYLTTISGNILTDGNKINVTVEDRFVDADGNNQYIDYKTISSDNEFLAAVNTPGKYVVISDLHIANEGDTVTTLATRAGGATTTIDLNGKTITVDNKGTGALASVTADNTLVITDSVAGGKIELTEGSTGAFIENNGTVVIENGSIKSNSTNDSPVIENNGTTNITGGVIGDNAVENTQNGDVNITGGTLEGDDFDDFIDDDYTKNENNEIVKKPTIAKIGDAEYTSLIKAVKAVEDGGTITLVNNETFTEENRSDNSGWWDGLSYSGDKSFTIDLNSKTICQEDGALNDYLIWIKNDGSKANTITLKNGTLDAGTTAYCAFATASSNKQKITINLENVNLIGNNSSGAVAKIRGGAELNVKAGTVITGKNNYVGIECVGSATVVNIYEGAKIYQNGTTSYWGSLAGASGNGVINVYGGEGTSAKGGFIAMTSGGTINVNGGEWIANTDGTYANGNDSVLIAQSDKMYNAGAGNSVINVTGGTFKGGYNCYGNAVGDAQINIKGGNFNANPASYVVAGYESEEENGVWTVGLPEALVKFLTDIAKGDEVTLDADITLLEPVVIESGKTIVLDLNGKTITGTSAKDAGAIIQNNGTLTIVGGTINNTYTNGDAVINNNGELVLEGVKIEGAPLGDGGYSAYTVISSGKMTINDGTEVYADRGCLKLSNGGETFINGGLFVNNDIGTRSLTSHVVDVENGGNNNLTINGGTFEHRHTNTSGGVVICNRTKGTVYVKGGEFSGGNYYGNNNLSDYGYGGTFSVTGGTYSAKPADKYLAEGYKAIEENGKIVVVAE